MTVEALLQEASSFRAGHPWSELKTSLFCQAVVALLSSAEPCGWPKPNGIVCDGRPGVEWDAISDILPPDEARGIAIMLLRAADEAER